ncbi:MAG: hypothetical protein U0R19_26890 [Bryobacteraceae bacterium]
MKEVESGTNLPAQLQALKERLRTVLPEEYQDRYEDVQPVSMGSAGLQYDAAGKVAWDQIWDHFCDLAMAGGPPHKGKLLEPAPPTDIAANPDRHYNVVKEICRAVRMVSTLAVAPSSTPGWVSLMCDEPVMAAWLVRAITMENVSARLIESDVEVPAGPHFRLEKEIKNVVTSVAKTFHYFDGHIMPAQQRRIAALFAESKEPLLQPCYLGEFSPESVLAAKSAASDAILQATGLPSGGAVYTGWLGLECPSVRMAIWMMRALVAGNTLSRREHRFLYVPIHPKLDPAGTRVAALVSSVYSLAVAAGVSQYRD